MTQRVQKVTRNLVVQRWGTPQSTIGSVNEPREMEENGQHFNEKWVYRNPKGDPGHPKERIVYWHRYDFVGSFLRDSSGNLVPEDPRSLLAGLDDRRYQPITHSLQQRG